MNNLTWNEFLKIETRVGTIIHADIFKAVKNPAFKMMIDFGVHGFKNSVINLKDFLTTLHSNAQ